MNEPNEPRRGPTIAFVGLGRIGRPMAERLLDAGFAPIMYDIERAALQHFAGRAHLASSPSDAADRADVVFACLQAVEQYAAAVTGKDGVIHGRRVKTYVHVGTTGRECVQTLASALGARGIVTLDAPMSGGVAGAVAGTLVSMVAGPRAAFEAVEPCLASYSRRIVHLGTEPGLAQTMKLVNNMLSAANLAAACEVMAVGAKAGLPVDVMLDVLNHGTGMNSATLTKIPNNVVPRTFDTGASLANVFKDLSAYAGEARRAGLRSTICETVLECFREAARQGTAQDDISTVVRPFERALGAELKRAG